MRALLLRCGEHPLALPALAVGLIAPAGPTMALPRLPAWVEGVAAYGRDVVPQIAVGRRLGLPEEGEIVVVASSAAGPVALRVTAAMRVVDGEAMLTGAGADPLFGGFLRHGGGDMPLLDLARLDLPLTASPPSGSVGPGPVANEAVADSDRDRGPPADLLCRAGTRRLRLPRASVLAIERAREDAPAFDLAPERAPGTSPPFSVTLATPRGPCLVGVDEVLGFGSDPAAEPVDTAGLAGAPAAPAREAPAAGPRRLPLLLATAGTHQVLVPRVKVVRVGRTERWRDLPSSAAGVSSVVAMGSDLLPVLDLGGLLGGAPASRPLAVAVETRGSRWAIACDGVRERHAAIDGRPATVDGLPSLGMASIVEGVLPVIDVDRLPLPGLVS